MFSLPIIEMKRSNQTRNYTRKKIQNMEEQYGKVCSIQRFRKMYPPCIKQNALERSNLYQQLTNRCTLTNNSARQYLNKGKGPFTYKHSTKNRCNHARNIWNKKYGKIHTPAKTLCEKKMVNIAMNAVILEPCTSHELIEFSRTRQ